MPLHIAGDGDAGGLNLLGVQPATFQRLQAVLAEGDPVASPGQACAAAAVHLAVLDSFGHQWHRAKSNRTDRSDGRYEVKL